MSKLCSHCGKWTCACGAPAVALLALRASEVGILGSGFGPRIPPDAFCALCHECLEKMASIHVNGIASLPITWLKQEMKL